MGELPDTSRTVEKIDALLRCVARNPGRWLAITVAVAAKMPIAAADLVPRLDAMDAEIRKSFGE